MTKKNTALASALLLLTVALTGCSALSDPAVRLARCLERGSGRVSQATPEVELSCSLEAPAQFLVLLHPEGELSDAELVVAGLPEPVIPTLRAFRLSSNEAIYVFEASGPAGSSRTTYQGRFVHIPAPLVVRKEAGGKVTVDLRLDQPLPSVEGVR